jgi:hypothetical protein
MKNDVVHIQEHSVVVNGFAACKVVNLLRQCHGRIAAFEQIANRAKPVRRSRIAIYLVGVSQVDNGVVLKMCTELAGRIFCGRKRK